MHFMALFLRLPFFGGSEGKERTKPLIYLREMKKCVDRDAKQTSVTNTILRISSLSSTFNVATKRLVLLSQMGATSCIGMLAAEYCSSSTQILLYHQFLSLFRRGKEKFRAWKLFEPTTTSMKSDCPILTVSCLSDISTMYEICF